MRLRIAGMGCSKGLACVLWAGMAACAAAAAGEPDRVEPAVRAEAGEVPFLGGFLRETRILYPLEVAGWTAGDEHIYDEQRDGVSVRFVRDGDQGWIDVYFYPAGVIDREEFATAAEAERESIRQVRTQSDDQPPELSALQAFDVAASAGAAEVGLPAYALDALLHSGGVAYHSAMAIVLDRMYFVKGRMSRPAESTPREALRGELESFMRALGSRLTILSTGRCWDAPLGIGMLGRDVPGCAGRDPVEPEVEAGMREIRIEYRPPRRAPPAAPATIQRG